MMTAVWWICNNLARSGR